MRKNKHGLTYIQWLIAAFGEHVRVAEIPEGAHEAWEDGVDPKSSPKKVEVNWAEFTTK